jgi:hypothetical protein
MEPEDNRLVRIEGNAKVLEVIRALNLPQKDKQELEKKLMSDDVEVIKYAKQKLADSGVAQHDISNFLGELERLSKKGMYATTKLEAKTGSGKIEMQFKGGDTKLIIPVLVILGIVIIAALVIVFWR